LRHRRQRLGDFGVQGGFDRDLQQRRPCGRLRHTWQAHRRQRPYAINEAAGEAIARARAGEGPSLLEIETYRLAGHFMGDAEGYRPKGEKDALFAKDPIPKMRAKMIADGVATAAELDAIEAQAAARVEQAIKFARESADPAPETALTSVFA
jgi:acetoin:2,6-dichlorophenolindophenol oxidoreductase subunit alpha